MLARGVGHQDDSSPSGCRVGGGGGFEKGMGLEVERGNRGSVSRRFAGRSCGSLPGSGSNGAVADENAVAPGAWNVGCCGAFEISQRFAKASRNAELTVLVDTGHFELIDPRPKAWKTVEEAVLDWS
jgi:hypothetical protein